MRLMRLAAGSTPQVSLARMTAAIVCVVIAAGLGASRLWAGQSPRATSRPGLQLRSLKLPPFSAEQVVTDGSERRTVKIYVTEKALRSEGVEDGQAFIVIVRLDRNVAWRLSAEKRTYDETAMSFGIASGRLKAFDKHACWVTEERVSGYSCRKEQCRIPIAGKTHLETRWKAQGLGGLAIKETIGTRTLELGNIKLGPQDPALFEIPAGFTKTKG